jgi:FMN-dependent NADH-azoreductase
MSMKKILYIKASPRRELSSSVAVAEAFLTSYLEANPSDVVVSLDLFAKDLPALDGLAVQARYAILQGLKPSAAEAAAWMPVEEIIREFMSCDKYVLAVPMWNFGLPYRLKHYLDLLIQPGYTFSFIPEAGHKGLVTNRPVFISFSRGGEYAAGSGAGSLDHQTGYLQQLLGFIGFTDIRQVVVESTLMGGPKVAGVRRDAAVALAKGMAKSF